MILVSAFADDATNVVDAVVRLVTVDVVMAKNCYCFWQRTTATVLDQRPFHCISPVRCRYQSGMK